MPTLEDLCKMSTVTLDNNMLFTKRILKDYFEVWDRLCYVWEHLHKPMLESELRTTIPSLPEWVREPIDLSMEINSSNCKEIQKIIFDTAQELCSLDLEELIPSVKRQYMAQDKKS